VLIAVMISLPTKLEAGSGRLQGAHKDLSPAAKVIKHGPVVLATR
jgi:hypothetical protein